MNTLKSKLSLSIKIPTAKEANSLNNLAEAQEKKATQQKSECNLIYDNIYLSGYNNASDLDFLTKNSFTHIINCAKSSRNFTAKNFENLVYLNLSIEDDPGFPIAEAIKSFIDFIENANKTQPSCKILVHCFEGISRAPSLLAAYLIWKLQISKEAALKFIKEKRPCVEINLGFLYQLEKWSKFCEDKNKLLNKKVKFSIKKSSVVKHENYLVCNSNSNDNSDNGISPKEENGIEEDCFFFHSKIRVIELTNLKENYIKVIRITNYLNKENENQYLKKENNDDKNRNNKIEFKINEQKAITISNED